MLISTTTQSAIGTNRFKIESYFFLAAALEFSESSVETEKTGTQVWGHWCEVHLLKLDDLCFFQPNSLRETKSWNIQMSKVDRKQGNKVNVVKKKTTMNRRTKQKLAISIVDLCIEGHLTEAVISFFFYYAP